MDICDRGEPIVTSSYMSLTPGTHAVPKSHGMKRLTLARLAASTRTFWLVIASADTVLIRMSIPAKTLSSSSELSFCQSEGRISTPRFLRVVTCGFETELGLTSAASLLLYRKSQISGFLSYMDGPTHTPISARAFRTTVPTFPVAPTTSTSGLVVGISCCGFQFSC